jgi:hypothetical protein
MRKMTLFLAALFLLLALSPSLQASEVRMMGLANPWLTIPDPDTDWRYNPAYILNAPNQAFGQYIFGYGKRKEHELSLSPLGVSSWDDYYHLLSHVGELGFIYNLGKGKLGFTGGYSYYLDERYKTGAFTGKGTDTDIPFQAVYAIPLNSELSLGLSASYDRRKEKSENNYISYWDRTIIEYHRWDVSLGVSWKPNPKLKVGLSGSGGGYPGDYTGEDTGYKWGGDHRGIHAQLLGNLEYRLNERVTIPVILRGRWDNKKINYNESVPGFYSINEEKDLWWDILVKTGANYLIDKNSNFLFGGELYYTYTKWNHKEVDSSFGFFSSIYNDDENRPTHTIGIRVGLERKIWEELIGRMGIYYSYSFYKINEDYYQNGFLNRHSSGNGWSQNLGIGFGLSYTMMKKLRFDLGFDIPFINKDHYHTDTLSLIFPPWKDKYDQREILYRGGLNLTYFF